jgi:hypothetical protein
MAKVGRVAARCLVLQLSLDVGKEGAGTDPEERTMPTGNVALTFSLPVDVLMKSAPAIMHTRLARATLRSVASSPVARIVFR